MDLSATSAQLGAPVAVIRRRWSAALVRRRSDCPAVPRTRADLRLPFSGHPCPLLAAADQIVTTAADDGGREPDWIRHGTRRDMGAQINEDLMAVSPRPSAVGATCSAGSNHSHETYQPGLCSTQIFRADSTLIHVIMM